MATITVTSGLSPAFVSGDIVTPTKLNLLGTPTVALTAGTIVDDDVSASAVIAHSKLANITAGQVLLGNASNVPTATAITGDVTVTNAGVTAIGNAKVTAPMLTGAQTGSAPIYGCRAWVNFDGTKDTTGAASTANTNRLIRASGNVASVLRNGTGNYTITFTTDMEDGNYAILATVDNPESTTVNWGVGPISQSSGSFQILIQNSGGVNNDRSIIALSIFR